MSAPDTYAAARSASASPLAVASGNASVAAARADAARSSGPYAAAATTPCTHRAASPLFHAVRISSASRGVLATSASRWAKCARPARAVQQAAGKSAVSCSALAASCRCHAALSRRSASSDFALRHSNCGRVAGIPGVADTCAGASTTTCAFVPLKPKALMPARDARERTGHGRAVVTMSMPDACQATCGLSCVI